MTPARAELRSRHGLQCDNDPARCFRAECKGSCALLRMTSRRFATLAALLVLAACSGGKSEPQRRGGRKGAAEAGYVELHSEVVPLRLELPGPHRGVRDLGGAPAGLRHHPGARSSRKARWSRRATCSTASIRAAVRVGLEPGARRSRRARSANSRAAKARAERIAELAKAEVVSKQDLLDAQSAADGRRRRRASARAPASTTADINLQFTRGQRADHGPHRPLRRHHRRAGDGRPGRAARHHPAARSDLRRHPAVERRRCSRCAAQLAGGDLARASTEVQLSSKTAAAIRTRACCSSPSRSSIPSTGTVTVRARFPNPEGLLLPGMYVRAEFSPVAGAAPRSSRRSRASRATRRATPPRWWSARTRRPSCAPSSPTARSAISGSCRKGLQAGDRLIVEGLGRIKAGQTVQPVAVEPGAASADRATLTMISRIFIDRPVLAWVISIVIMLGGVGGIRAAAGRAVSGHRAAVGQHPRQLPGRVGRDARIERHAGDRAAAHRHRRADLLLVELERVGRARHHRHLRRRAPTRTSRRCRCRTRCSRRCRACRSGAAAGPGRHQVATPTS